MFHHGLFGYTSSDRGRVFLERGEAEQIARDTAAKYRDQHLTGRFLWTLWELDPVYTMIDTDAWDDACRERLSGFFQDPRAVDALTLMFFGRHYTTGRGTISKFVDLETYFAAVERRLADEGMHESVRLALKKAKDPFWE